MKHGLWSVVVLAIVFIFSIYGASLAEDAYAPSSAEAPGTAVPAEVSAAVAEITPEIAQETDVLWLWGEVVSVDAQRSELTVKYLDYESDNEKEITVVVGDKTGYEGIKSLDELKAMDTVSIDYVVADGKNSAKNISVEKPENMEPAKDDTGSFGIPDVQEPPQGAGDIAIPLSAPESNPPSQE